MMMSRCPRPVSPWNVARFRFFLLVWKGLLFFCSFTPRFPRFEFKPYRGIGNRESCEGEKQPNTK